MEQAAGCRWHVVAEAAVLTREWDGQLVLYHGGTGNTHLLDGDAAVVFNVLRKGPATTLELAARLEEGSTGGKDDRQTRLRQILNALQRLDIVEPLGETERAARG